MDPASRSRGTKTLLVGVALLFAGASLAPSAAAEPGPRVVDASPAERREVADALSRFSSAGLELPPLEIVFHDEPSGCRDRNGFYEAGRVDVCTGAIVNLFTETTLLHEMAHAWSEANLDATRRAAFLRLRGLSSWSSWNVPWTQRGWEHAAEILRWGIFGVSEPEVPFGSIDQLVAAYRFLTGSEPPIMRG